MRNFPALVVIIILIAALIIVVGFVIASITHKYSTEQESPVETTRAGNELLELDQKIFALQLFSADKIAKIEHQQQKLENAGFKTRIMKSVKDENINYNLQLEGLYGEKEAITLGEEIKRKVPSVQSYWLDQIGTNDNNEPDITEQNKDNRIQQFLKQAEETSKTSQTSSSIDELKYEIQIMASGNYARIEEVKGTLASMGYKTKILTLTQTHQIIYRLRLKGSYTEREAIQIGEKMVSESPLVNNYWLDEITDEKTLPRNTQVTKSKQQPKPIVDSGRKDYEIQILANKDLAKVSGFKQTLDRNGYPAKITTAIVKGTTFYRLRLDSSYSKPAATEVGKQLVKDVKFVKDFWVVKKTPRENRVTASKPTPKPAVKKTVTKPEPQRSTNPAYQNKTVNYSATCNRNSINIRSGAGTHYTIDPIGKLMRGITIFVVEEKDGWARFTITPNDESWSGWVKLEYIDKN